MDLLKAIFDVPNLRGDIALYAKGANGGTRFVTLDSLDPYMGEKDWYFHLATHERTLIRPGGRGSKKSAEQFTVLWLDLDLATKKPIHPTIEEAQGLIDHMKSHNWGPSAIVHSGGGLHLYWLLSKPEECYKFPSACKAWVTFVVQKLNELCNREIHLDQVGDMARVLRLPGSIHSTAGRPVRVLELDENRRYHLKDLLDLTTYFQQPERGTGKTAIKNKLLEAMGSVKASIPSYTKFMIRSCGQVRNFFETAGDVSEPEWYSMAGLLPYTEDGLDYFLNLSKIAGDAAALAKIEQWESASTGPATCQRMYDNNPSICQACPHFRKITTPLQLGYSLPTVVDIETKEIIAPSKSFIIEHEHYVDQYVPPQPFSFDKDGALCATVEDSTGTNRVKVICHNKVVPYKRIWSEADNEEVIYFNILTPNDGWREVDVPLSSLGGSCPALSKIMGSGALIVNSHAMIMAGYLTGCVKYMQQLKKVNRSYSRIGWRCADGQSDTRDNDDKFVLGELTFYKNGGVKQESLVPDLKQSLRDIGMKGNIDEWKQAVSILAKPGFERHLICFMGAFAVPLFRSTDYHGLIVNLLSRESGTFKSFTLKLISSVYGEPKLDHILKIDSPKSILAKVANRCDLPITYDEITNISSDDLSELSYSITQGRRADRLNQDSTLRQNDSVWRTILFSTSNASLDDKLTNNLAERMRILEFPVKTNTIDVSDAEARAVTTLLDNNYGQAGVLWMKYVMENKQILFDECTQMISDLTTITKSRSDKRFWISFLAFVLVSAKHTRLIGLHSFDVKAMADTCKAVLDSSSSKVDSDFMPLPMYASQFLSSHLDNTLSVTYTSMNARTGDCKREPRAEMTIKIESRASGPGKMQRVAFIGRKSMQAYLTEMRVSFKDFIDELRNCNVLMSDHMIKRITIPNSPETFRLTCFSIDLDKLDELYMTEGESIDKGSVIL